MRDSGAIVALMHRGLMASGLDVGTIYRQLGYDLREVTIADCRPRHSFQPQFWQVVENVSQDPDVALHLCRQMPLFLADGLVYLIIASPRFIDGLALLGRYTRLISDAFEFSLHDQAGDARLVFKGATGTAEALRHAEICFVYQMVSTLRYATDGALLPTAIRLRCAQRSPLSEYQDVFGCPVTFDGAANEIRYADDRARQRSPNANPELLQQCRVYLQRKLVNVHNFDRMDALYDYFLAELEVHAGSTMVTSEIWSLTRAAADLGLSERRLRYELKQTGTSFRELLTRVRMAHAKRLLVATAEPVATIAQQTGFIRGQAFAHAFHRATGQTPSEFRNR